MNPFLALMTTHYVADFVLQNGWMANNKSRNVFALTAHVLVYASVFAVLGTLGNVAHVFDKAVLTFVLHWLTDFCTSKCTRYFWYTLGNRYLFFGTIGLDQLIHTYCLVWVYRP